MSEAVEDRTVEDRAIENRAVKDQAALQSYVDKWLAAQPQQRIALVFVPPRVYPGHVALAALEQEWLTAVYGIGEMQVAAAKLHWWAEELADAARNDGQHPLTRALFGDERTRAWPSERWIAPVFAAMAQLEAGTAADFPAQLAAAAPLHEAIAALETAWWFGENACSERAGRIATLSHLLLSLGRLEEDADRDRLALPMDRLARHGLHRHQLRSAGAAREQAISAQLEDLQQAFQASEHLPGPLSVFRALECRQSRILVARARQAAQPLQVLRQGLQRPSLGTVWQAWRAARAWQRQVG